MSLYAIARVSVRYLRCAVISAVARPNCHLLIVVSLMDNDLGRIILPIPVSRFFASGLDLCTKEDALLMQMGRYSAW